MNPTPIEFAARQCEEIARRLEEQMARAGEERGWQYDYWEHDAEALRMAARLLRMEFELPPDSADLSAPIC